MNTKEAGLPPTHHGESLAPIQLKNCWAPDMYKAVCGILVWGMRMGQTYVREKG